MHARRRLGCDSQAQPSSRPRYVSRSYRSEVDKKRDSFEDSTASRALSREEVGLGPIRIGVGKKVTHIHWLPGLDTNLPSMRVCTPGHQLSLSHARNLSVCADLEDVEEVVQ
jgi:hypothetical protein